MAMILACAALLHYAAEMGHGEQCERGSKAIYDSVFDATGDGIRTSDLGGHASTTEFTDAVIERVRERLGT